MVGETTIQGTNAPIPDENESDFSKWQSHKITPESTFDRLQRFVRKLHLRLESAFIFQFLFPAFSRRNP